MSEFLNNTPYGFDEEGNTSDRQTIGYNKPKNETSDYVSEKLHTLNSMRSSLLIQRMKHEQWLEENAE